MYSNTDNSELSNFLGVKAVCYKMGPTRIGTGTPPALLSPRQHCRGRVQVRTSHTHTCTPLPRGVQVRTSCTRMHTHTHALLQWQCCKHPNCRSQVILVGTKISFSIIFGHTHLQVQIIFRRLALVSNTKERKDSQHLNDLQIVKIRCLLKWKNQIITCNLKMLVHLCTTAALLQI